MSPFQGVATAACLVLIASGVAKIGRPDATVRALFAAKVPHRRSFVFAIGGFEIVLGAVGLVVAGPVVAVLLALTFAGFDIFIWRMHAVGGAEGCGCFGAESDVTPGRLHVVLNAALVAGCLATVNGSQSALDTVTESPGTGSALVTTSAAAAFLLVLSYTRLATILDLTRSDPAPPEHVVPPFRLAPPTVRRSST